MSFLIFYHDEFLEHGSDRHPESPDRLRWIRAVLEEEKLWNEKTVREPNRAERSWIERVHTKELVDRVEQACRQAPAALDVDTVVSKQSFNAALRACGAAMEAVDFVCGEGQRAFCLVRPPGHHAEPNKAMGFCLFNNVAVAAVYAREKHKKKRIAILDFDVHHGNGTQRIFYEDGDVLYISLHCFPLYPFTGLENERGRGAGKGTTLNITFSPRTPPDLYIQRFHREAVPTLEKFEPELILISAGFDAYENDPIGTLLLKPENFAEMTEAICAVADDVCSGRVVSCLEGGYDRQGLAACAAAHVRALSKTIR